MTVYFFMDEKEVDPNLHANKREAWMPKDGNGYYDKSARRFFRTRQEKRAWLASNKTRETGELVDPNKPISGRKKVRVDTQRREAIANYIRSQGGTEGLLNKLGIKT